MTDPIPLTDARALDRFIAGNTPAWLRSASSEQLEQLHQSLSSHHRHQARVGELLARIQAPEDFAMPRLLDVLRELGCTPQPAQALWRDIRLRVEMPVFRITDVDLPSFHHYPVDSDLLGRLLRNFNEDEARDGAHYPGSGIVEGGRLLACAPAEVAARCRTLDLGGQYQRHLREVLTPDDLDRRQEVIECLRDDKRAALAAHARCACLKGEIDGDAERLLLDLADGRAVSRDVSPGHLQLLGFDVQGALLLEMAATHPRLPGQVLLYLPNDPNRTLHQCESLALLDDELASQLRHPPYAEFFTRQLQPDDRLSFLGKLQSCLQAPSPALQAQGVAIGSRPFEWQAQRQIARIKSDAAQLLVPTAAVDQALFRQRIEALKSAGLAVGGLLASFIPGVGEFMLVGLVKDVLSEVYEGVVDWSHGQCQEALDHLLGVVGNLAITALIGAGVGVVVRELQRSSFVDGLLPVLHGDGRQRLWSAERARHQVPLALTRPADADGLVRVQGRHWWRRGEQVFEVQQAAPQARWRIVHPSRPGAWTPELTGNGDGAWWHAGEDPLQWQGSAALLRRFGPRTDGLTAAACEQVAAICGHDEASLRGLLVERRPMPVELVQVVADFSLDARIADFFEQLAEGAALERLDPELCAALRALRPGSAEERVTWNAEARTLQPLLFEHLAQRLAPVLDADGLRVQRLFPGLPERFVEALLDEAGMLDGERRLPLELQEKARRTLHEVRVLQAVEGLYLDSRCTSDTVRMAFSLFRSLSQWPRGLSFELRENTVDGPVLERILPLAEAREVRVLVGAHGHFRAYETNGTALGEAGGSLFQALVDGLDARQRAALGCNDATAMLILLRQQADIDRQRLPGLLGISRAPAYFRSPQRLADGRRGYPLSGRGRPGSSTLTSMVRTLYPGFSELEASIWLDEIQQLHGDPMGVLLRGQESLRSLDQALSRWVQDTPLLGRGARRRVADEIRRCWCRQTAAVLDVEGRVMGYRLRLSRSLAGDLPELPEAVDFSHVLELNLSAANQGNRVNGFLQRFTRLRCLDLGTNACDEIPPALASMPGLQELYLDGNQIRFTDSAQATLSALPRLEVLTLDRNPLGRVPDIRPLLRLRRLSLRGTGIAALPEGLVSRSFLELADLRGNELEALPETFFAAPARIRSATVLFGNPLRREVRERLWTAGEQDGMRADQDESDGLREQWLAGMHDDLLRERDEQWQSLRDEPGSAAFFSLVGNLLETAEYRLAPEHLRERVWQMIGAAVENTALRQSLFELASAPTTCVDSVSASFSVLDVRLQVSQAAARAPEGEQDKALLAFARRLFRLDRVEKHALQVISRRRLTGELVDEVEVSLAFRVRLAEALQLPGQPRHMQFGDIAGVSEADLEAARAAVESAEAGPELADFIARQDFWIEHLRERHAADFRRIEARFWERLERLCEAQTQVPVPEGDYLERMNQLGTEREQALHEQARIFTGQALEAGEQR
ncbi:NEL-type E3 ubiquitin ligase domain-containing protein [Pseudomonas putida]|uniref:RING-type E3 ubiquitin transferase n=1 Tax=Pseudomonas putida TaxID=303 RepID=A0A1Q9QUW6_PSEPU|nr:NEL-type E3 ubiquitin ligase domain-containing protein [Pseudomonas putida]OLS58951.1 hypothetical protein PSEMO_63120 [Pseudomonas putida]